MKILFAHTPGFTPEMYDAFTGLGLEPAFLSGPESQPYTDDFSDIDLIICYRFFCYTDLARFPALKYIHTTSSGLDHMPMDAIRSRGIALDNARGVYSVPMAEFALGAVLQLYKGALPFRAQQQAHVWQPRTQMRELGGKRVTILGTGSVGTECARRFTAMGCRCVGLCRHPRDDAPAFAAQYAIDRLDAVLPETDILLLALPLTGETRGLLNARRLALLPSDAVLVNLARGPVIEADALLEMLSRGALAGAAVDVFDPEPLPPDSPFWDAENLILTPHNSFVGEGNPRRLFDLCYRDIAAWLRSRGTT